MFVDCTAAEEPVDHYGRLLRTGVSVVAANKRGIAGELALYRHLCRGGGSGAGLYYETTVGAGLPVIRTLEDLVATGDRVRRIEGVLSGTLAYIFDAVTDGDPFSEAVRRAQQRGYTEPDPREDLRGRDVARKALILGRETGLGLEPADISVAGVLPGDGWESLSLDGFWERLPEVDARFDRMRTEALREDTRLRYLTRIERPPGDGRRRRHRESRRRGPRPGDAHCSGGGAGGPGPSVVVAVGDRQHRRRDLPTVQPWSAGGARAGRGAGRDRGRGLRGRLAGRRRGGGRTVQPVIPGRGRRRRQRSGSGAPGGSVDGA